MSKPTAIDPNCQWMFSATRLPARLGAYETAIRLGFPVHAIPILIAKKHLKPLGKYTQKSEKKFAADVIEAHAHDVRWLDKATRSVDGYWSKKNKKQRLEKDSELPSKKTGRKPSPIGDT